MAGGVLKACPVLISFYKFCSVFRLFGEDKGPKGDFRSIFRQDYQMLAAEIWMAIRSKVFCISFFAI